MATNETDSTNKQQERKPWSTKSKVLATFAVALSAIALIAGVRLTVAAFSANDHLKAVAATSEAANLLSSDQLTAFTTSSPSDSLIPKKSLVVGEGDAAIGLTSFSFSIYNYLQNDPTIWCDKDITYVITVSVEGSSNASSCKLNGTAFSAETKSAKLEGQKLAGRRQDSNLYIIQLPKEDINNTTFKVRVSVTDPGGTMIRSMAADISPSLKATVNPVTCKIESRNSGGDKPNDFDGYNYDVTVEGSQTKVKLTWSPALVQLDPFFSDKHEVTNLNKDKGEVTFTMDPGTTSVIFYRLDGKINADTDWDALQINAERVE